MTKQAENEGPFPERLLEKPKFLSDKKLMSSERIQLNFEPGQW